jgi:aminoglycoside phosphotransferase (APT) family kinase protein
LRYTAPGGGSVFAKVYVDDSGAHSHAVLRTLWEDGFGSASRYRVSEPLAFLPDHNVLLVRGAGELTVASALDERGLAEGAREAARWLARLHASPVRVGRTRYPWEVYHKLMHRLAKAAAAHPARVDDLLELYDRFESLTRTFELRFVQTHGQFRHIHVFLEGPAVTVIDLDRSRPADPAQDLGEFVHRMRTKRFKATAGASRAEEATTAFLEAYLAVHPGNDANLPFYWGYHALVSMWKFMKSATPEDPAWQPMLDYYRSEFEDAVSRRWRA